MSAVDTSKDTVERRIAHHEETAEAWRDIGLPGAGNALDAAMYRALLAERDRLLNANASLVNDTVLMGLARDDAYAERDAARREVGQMREVLEHLNAEIVFGGQLQELVDAALGGAREEKG